MLNKNILPYTLITIFTMHNLHAMVVGTLDATLLTPKPVPSICLHVVSDHTLNNEHTLTGQIKGFSRYGKSRTLKKHFPGKFEDYKFKELHTLLGCDVVNQELFKVALRMAKKTGESIVVFDHQLLSSPVFKKARFFALIFYVYPNIFHVRVTDYPADK